MSITAAVPRQWSLALALVGAASVSCGDIVSQPIVPEGDTGEAGGTSAAVGGRSTLGSGGGAPEFGGVGGYGEPIFEDPFITVEGAVPEIEHCAPVNEWLFMDSMDEEGLLNSLNAIRSTDGLCGEGVSPFPVPSLVMSPELRCSARLHALDMVSLGFRDEVSPWGATPLDRVTMAGYVPYVAVEVIAESMPGTRPYMVLAALVEPAGLDCEKLLDPGLIHVGIGLVEGVWTIDLAVPGAL